MQLTPGKILVPQDSCKIMKTPHRVLDIDTAAATVWGIALPRFRENGRVMGYVRGPVALPLDIVTTQLERGDIVQAKFRAPGFWAMPDAEFASDDLPDAEKSRRKALQLKRDTSWRAIEPIVAGASLSELLGTPSIRALINERAEACGRSSVTIYRLLHVYWAHGSVKNGLYPMTHRCGAKGKERQPRKPMGRRRSG